MMKPIKLTAVAAATFALLACSSSEQTRSTETAPPPTAAEPAQTAEAPAAEQDIVAIASGAGQFETLVAAIQAADLVEALQGPGPFTVFAPTDEAFAKLPDGTIEALLADKDKLTAVLTYHVVSGKVMAADVAGLTEAKTLQGQSIAIDTSAGVKVDRANVVKTDIQAKNGVIHVIDTVLIPE